MGDIHELKCLEKYFDDALNEGKKAEFRRNDRDFKTGDLMVLKEVRRRQYSSLCIPDSYYYEYENTGRSMICSILNVTKVNDIYSELKELPEFVMISFRILFVRGGDDDE